MKTNNYLHAAHTKKTLIFFNKLYSNRIIGTYIHETVTQWIQPIKSLMALKISQMLK